MPPEKSTYSVEEECPKRFTTSKAATKAEITAIYHENKGRYGYRRITDELHNRKLSLIPSLNAVQSYDLDRFCGYAAHAKAEIAAIYHENKGSLRILGSDLFKQLTNQE